MQYYQDSFNYKISIPLGYGLEFGKNWATLNDWNFRVEGYEATVKDKKTDEMVKKYIPGLLDMVRDEGKRMDRPFDKVVADTKWLMNIREKELRTDPYKMMITDNTIGRAFEKLNMFKDQLEDA
jgi:hypothetical protein